VSSCADARQSAELNSGGEIATGTVDCLVDKARQGKTGHNIAGQYVRGSGGKEVLGGKKVERLEGSTVSNMRGVKGRVRGG
jgi:hypothetical protein